MAINRFQVVDSDRQVRKPPDPSIVAGGVYERFPRFRFTFLEGNASGFPIWLWRMDEHWEARRSRAKMGVVLHRFSRSGVPLPNSHPDSDRATFWRRGQAQDPVGQLRSSVQLC